MAIFYAPRCIGFNAACLLLGLAALACMKSRVDAADMSWGNNLGGNFSTASNWQSCGFFCFPPPDSNDVAHFGLSDPSSFFQFVYTVNFTTNPTNQAFFVEDDLVTFALGAHVYTTTQTSAINIGMQPSRFGSLTITNGTVAVPFQSEVAVGVFGPGGLTVSTGGLLAGTPKLFVGLGGGNSALVIQNNGDIIADDVFLAASSSSNSTATITGAGSSLLANILRVGQRGTGTLNITASGRIDSASGIIGDLAGSTGSANVSGAGSRWIGSQFLTVGKTGNGTLNVLAGGQVEFSGASLGASSGITGTINVDGASSRWTTSSVLTIGDAGQGTMNVATGGFVSSLEGHIGNQAGSSGTVTVRGAGSRWLNTSVNALDIGVDGTGTLHILDGGAVENTISNALIGRRSGSAGRVIVEGPGSTWNVGLALNVGFRGTGTLEILDGGVVSNRTGFIGPESAAESTATVDGSGSMWINSEDLHVGGVSGGSSVLNITGGGAVSNLEGFINSVSGPAAAVTVDGPGSTWTNSGELAVGANNSSDGGAGRLTVSGGGAVSNTVGTIGKDAGTLGAVTVTGAGSTWTNSGDLAVGDEGQGELTIASGGSVSNHVGYIGRNSDNGGAGSGDVTVTGAGSTWTNTNFVYVGYGSGAGGEGSLSVEAGGTVTCTTGFVGNVAGSHGTATVDGPGSTWTTSGTLAVGDGTLTISNGGAVVTNGLFGTLAAQSMSSAEVTIDGQGSSWSLAGALLTVGFGGTAAVNILDGGSVVSFDARLAADTGSTGTVLVSGAGSTWTIGRRLGVGGDAGNLVSGGTATLNIRPGGTVNVAQSIVIFAGGLLRLDGGTLDAAEVSFQGGGQFQFISGIFHVGTFNGSLTNQAGTLAPGHSAGSTTITGSYAQQPGGILEIEIGGNSPGSTYDVVNITSIAGISGQLQLALLNGFVPGASDTFTVLTAATGIFGTFSNVANGSRLATFDDLGSFQINYGPGSAFNPNHIVLSNFIPNSLPGDFNDDGRADAADYVVWRKTDGSSLGYSAWRTNFGRTAGAGSLSNAKVPEPSAALWLGITAAIGCWRTLPTGRERPKTH